MSSRRFLNTPLWQHTMSASVGTSTASHFAGGWSRSSELSAACFAGMMSASANLRSNVAEERERRTLAKAKKEHHITWAEIWAGHPAEAALQQMHPGWLESEEANT